METLNLIYDSLNKINELIVKFIKNYNSILDLYIKNNITQYDLIKSTIKQCENGIQQRTEEWYKLRGTCITASDIGAFLGIDKYKSTKKAIECKSGIKTVKIDNKYTQWGNKYEDIAARIYEKMFNVKVYDAPLLIHYVYPFIGASCDGFVVDDKNKNGYLIEIKCPLARQLGDSIPEHYISQPRTQMEVVKADRCDFFECKIEEYKNYNEYENDKKAIYKGFIIAYTSFNNIDDNGYLRYMYHYPDDIYNKDFQKELNLVKETVLDSIDHKPVFWKLNDFRNHIITREPAWFEEVIPQLEKCWNIIIENRNVQKEGINNS